MFKTASVTEVTRSFVLVFLRVAAFLCAVVVGREPLFPFGVLLWLELGPLKRVCVSINTSKLGA